ncbi:MAG: DUF1501 domain-containing protein [Acidobacteria bacterium]|nr:DUF1501 domain-containing protein [Acidobacteriota bacterium]
MISRGVFIRNGGLALVSLGFAPSFLTRTVEATGTARRKVLVTIFQRGAVDGLNMVVPFGERDYYASRPTIAIPRPGSGDLPALDLDGFFAFHPRLAPLQKLYARGELAIVHACGSPDNTRSHFDAQDYMETATPGRKGTTDGWLNRYLQAKHADEHSNFRAVSLTQQLPRSLQGHAPSLAMSKIAEFGIRGNNMMGASFESQYAGAADGVLGGIGREAFDAIKTLRAATPERYQPANGADYPRSPFGQSMLQIGQLIKADLGLEVAFTEIGGWDNHVNQGGSTGQLATRLDDFGRSIAALVTDLGDRMSDVVILTMSEFGRAIAENGNRGTDHGHGNAMMAVGGAVKGGHVYGKWPGLKAEQRYERRDLAVTTDFRDVFAEVVVRHLGVADPTPIFPGHTIKPANFPGLF